MIAATRRRALPAGVGSVNALPTPRWCSSAKAPEIVAHPPSRSSRVARARLALQDLAGGDHHSVARGPRDDPHPAIADVEVAALVYAHRCDRRRSARSRCAVPPAVKALVVRSLPPVVTHSSAVAQVFAEARVQAVDQVGARAADRDAAVDGERGDPGERDRAVVTARSSETTTISELLRTRSPAQRRMRATPRTALGIASNAATASAMPPTIVSPRGEQHRDR